MEKTTKLIRTLSWINMIMMVIFMVGMIMMYLQQRKTHKHLVAVTVPAE